MSKQLHRPENLNDPSKCAWTVSNNYLLNVANISKTTCRACLEKIEQGDIRFGNIFHHREGFILIKWYHLLCIECPSGFHRKTAVEGSHFTPEQFRQINTWMLQKAFKRRASFIHSSHHHLHGERKADKDEIDTENDNNCNNCNYAINYPDDVYLNAKEVEDAPERRRRRASWASPTS